MLTSAGASLILLVVAAIFFALVLRDRLRGQAPNPARKAWLRVALIFSAVAAVLLVLVG